MSARDRRPRFRAAVYAERDGMTNGCRVLLLRLADSMSATGIVSVPRTKLAREFGVDPSRITERVKLARELGFLDITRRGRPGVTAVYQGLIPAPSMVRKTAPHMVRHSAPPERATWCATDPTQVVDAERESERSASVALQDEERSEEEAEDQPAAAPVTDCPWHDETHPCPEDCANHPATRRRTA